MNSRTTIKVLAIVGLAELLGIGWLLWQRRHSPTELLSIASLASSPSLGRTSAFASSQLEGAASQPALVQRNLALETELAEVKKELDIRKSEISFSYGSVRDSGRFVGMTFRKMFETAAAHEAKEAQERMADNQINVLSLGPFIQDAEVMESDPGVFAQFQAPLISEVLGIPADRGPELESLLGELKGQSLKLEAGSPEWIALNDTALKAITDLLSESRKQAMKGQIEFFQQYGVLVIPAYSILKSSAPSVTGASGVIH